MKNKLLNFLLLFLIVLFAACLRLIQVNWDSGYHLHPDERFLTMVAIGTKIPKTITEYLNQSKSPLNPANTLDGNGNHIHSFFVYGIFPLTINKIFAVMTGNDTYHGFTILGRILSAVFDLAIIVFIYKTGQLLEKQYKLNSSFKLWASFFYAIAVLPIQLSHFFAVDTFLNTFLFASWYFALRYYFSQKKLPLLISAACLGFALASKITAIFMLPVLLFFIVASFLKNTQRVHLLQYIKIHKKKIPGVFLSCFIFLTTAYLSLRLTNPYIFEYPSLLNSSISKLFIQNLQILKSWDSPDIWFPPAVQWINRLPVLFALKNLFYYGTGLIYSVFLCIGAVFVSIRYRKNPVIIFTTLWVLGFFLYQSTQFVKNSRYFIIIYPFLAMYAAAGFLWITQSYGKIIKAFFIFLLLLWPFAYISIYINVTTRVQASEWIYQNIPTDKVISWESWDDPLPLQLPKYIGRTYTTQTLPVFDPDTPEKRQRLKYLLAHTDYYILSSNRAWGSISRVPQKYPTTSKFYKDLLSGKAGFTLVKEISSYPSLQYLGIPVTINDDMAEESFTVYDHPKVLIFKRTTYHE